MIIKSYKNSKQLEIDHKLSNTELFKLFETSDGNLLKKYKMETIHYRNLLLFHQDKSYRDYLVELAKSYANQDIINIPLELYESQGFVQALIQRKLSGFMYLGNLAPKTNLEALIKAFNNFCSTIKDISGLDVSHIRINDIIYNGEFQILNPEFVLLGNKESQENLSSINQTILKGLYGLDEVTSYDSRIKEEIQSVVNGEIGIDVLLSKIKELEEKEFGKARYLKNISKGYVK